MTTFGFWFEMRLRWIDALKGIGIMLVVFAHHSLPLALNNYIYSFHMPLFFFISGFLFDFGKYAGSAANFVKGRFRSLIVPYFCFAVFTCLFYFFRKIGSSKVLEYYGRNCLIVLALHLPLKDVLTKLALMSFGVDPEYIISNAAFALSLTALNLLFLIPVIFIINNYFPFLVGKKGSSMGFEDFRTRFKKLVN